MSTSMQEVAARLATRMKERNALPTEEASEPEGEVQPITEVTPEEVPEAGDAPEMEAASPVAEPEDQGAEAAAPPPVPEATSEEYISTLTELAEHLDVEPEYLYSLSIPNSQGKALTLGELKDLAIEAETTKAAAEELRQQQERFQTEQVGLRQQFMESLATLNGLITSEAESIAEERNAIQGLREAEPEQYLIRLEDLRNRETRLQRDREAAVEAYNKAAQEEQHQQQAAMQEFQSKQRGLLTRMIPEWSDRSVMETEGRELSAFLSENGFTNDEIKNLADARSFKLARMAMLYQKTGSSKEATVARLQKLPKKLKSAGSAAPAPDPKASENKLKAGLKKGGSLKDAQALFKHRLKQREP